jgi:hypothetical protein
LKYGIYGAQANAAAGATWFQTLRTRLKAWCEAHGLYQPSSPESQLSQEREDLLSRMEIFSVNSTTFNVGFIYSDPGVTFQVTKDLYAQVIESLLEIRKHTLVNVRARRRSRRN